jgi:hypothetical protein
MNLKFNNTTCGFLQKHHQLVGLAPISIQAWQVKGCDKFNFIFLFGVVVLNLIKEEVGKKQQINLV